MNAIQSTNNYARVMWLAATLALFTALTYVLIAFNVLGVGDLPRDEKPPTISTSRRDVICSADR